MSTHNAFQDFDDEFSQTIPETQISASKERVWHQVQTKLAPPKRTIVFLPLLKYAAVLLIGLGAGYYFFHQHSASLPIPLVHNIVITDTVEVEKQVYPTATASANNIIKDKIPTKNKQETKTNSQTTDSPSVGNKTEILVVEYQPTTTQDEVIAHQEKEAQTVVTLSDIMYYQPSNSPKKSKLEQRVNKLTIENDAQYASGVSIKAILKSL